MELENRVILLSKISCHINEKPLEFHSNGLFQRTMKLLESVQDREANLASSFEQQLKTLPNIEIEFIKLLPDVKS